jgi:hypothetical protein
LDERADLLLFHDEAGEDRPQRQRREAGGTGKERPIDIEFIFTSGNELIDGVAMHAANGERFQIVTERFKGYFLPPQTGQSIESPSDRGHGLLRTSIAS